MLTCTVAHFAEPKRNYFMPIPNEFGSYPDDGGEPEEQPQKTTTIGDIFTPEQMEKLEHVYQQAKGEVMEMTELVKPWFNEPSMAAYLESKGMLPAYAVYAIPFHYAEARKKQDQQAQEADTEDIVNRVMGQQRPPHSQN